ncbi:aminoglycoside 6'-N-acetyltransferase [Pandoraea anhela]|uniref:aminoglycoside 6'-N-acetyltransferase n=1 Tax=Pandoraea anhela TaxID=2508295 RepID=UPI001240C3EB|nr:aminoglycoside 6'-N-acetyltransferase [Pandoraea anhela]
MSPRPFLIKRVHAGAVASLGSVRAKLWPDASASEHERDGRDLLSQPDRYVAFLAMSQADECLGFAEASIRRDYVNGCDTSPVLFLEGIYVEASMRRSGIARALCVQIEQWGMERGCTEFASDTALSNIDAQAIHRALGFNETERVVFFRKLCGEASENSQPPVRARR